MAIGTYDVDKSSLHPTFDCIGMGSIHRHRDIPGRELKQAAQSNKLLSHAFRKEKFSTLLRVSQDGPDAALDEPGHNLTQIDKDAMRQFDKHELAAIADGEILILLHALQCRGMHHDFRTGEDRYRYFVGTDFISQQIDLLSNSFGSHQGVLLILVSQSMHSTDTLPGQHRTHFERFSHFFRAIIHAGQQMTVHIDDGNQRNSPETRKVRRNGPCLENTGLV